MAAPTKEEWFQEIGEESNDARCLVYLVTFSRLLLASVAAAAGELRSLGRLTRKVLLKAVLDAFENPELGAGGGRTRQRVGRIVRKLVVVRETHVDGHPHFHAAVYLYEACRWAAVKRALRVRHRLAAHFSCSHREWWSALRYLVHTSAKKTVVDDQREVWKAPGESFDPFEESQQPYNADCWRAKREKRDKEAAATGKTATFTKLDFHALVKSKGLQKRASVMRYVQEKGTDVMRAFVCNNQKRLNELLAEASEWANARHVAGEEDLTDWALLCQAAEGSCCHGDNCPYHKAVQEIFDRNENNFDRRHLANSVRRIIVSGPSKDTRVPFLIGTTNTGKSTVVDSFDSLFGFERVFHLPAVTDGKYALRNWVRDKRFVYWDEFSPVEFAATGIFSVTTFKKAFGGQFFEVQMAQNWHDGNQDFRWQRGVVFTNKSESLWTPQANVSPEDVRHLQSRVELFYFTHQVVPPGSRPSRGNIPQCRHHLAKWIRDSAAAFDAMQAMQPALGATASVDVAAGSGACVADLDDLMARASVPAASQAGIMRDVAASGAVHVQELTREDWEHLPSWQTLKPLERRRIMRFVPPS